MCSRRQSQVPRLSPGDVHPSEKEKRQYIILYRYTYVILIKYTPLYIPTMPYIIHTHNRYYIGYIKFKRVVPQLLKCLYYSPQKRFTII